MEQVPDQSNLTKTHYLLRFTARDRTLDAALADLSDDISQLNLPEHLHVFSVKPLTVDRSDEVDGRSQSQSRYEQYRRGIQDYQHQAYRFIAHEDIIRPKGTETIDKIGLRIRLGSEAAARIIAPPLYEADKRQFGVIPVRYAIPHPAADIEDRLAVLERVLKDRPSFDELALVPAESPDRPYFVRDDAPRDMSVLEPYRRRMGATVIDLAAYRSQTLRTEHHPDSA